MKKQNSTNKNKLIEYNKINNKETHEKRKGRHKKIIK